MNISFHIFPTLWWKLYVFAANLLWFGVCAGKVSPLHLLSTVMWMWWWAFATNSFMTFWSIFNNITYGSLGISYQISDGRSSLNNVAEAGETIESRISAFGWMKSPFAFSGWVQVENRNIPWQSVTGWLAWSCWYAKLNKKWLSITWQSAKKNVFIPEICVLEALLCLFLHLIFCVLSDTKLLLYNLCMHVYAEMDILSLPSYLTSCNL